MCCLCHLPDKPDAHLGIVRVFYGLRVRQELKKNIPVRRPHIFYSTPPETYSRLNSTQLFHCFAPFFLLFQFLFYGIDNKSDNATI